MLGFLIAFLVGIAGMGGGPLAAPLLMLVLNVPSVTAVGTSLVFVAVTKAAATAFYFKRRQIDRNALLRLLAGGVPGVLVGTLAIQHAASNPRLQPFVLTLIGCVIAVMALLTFWRIFRPAEIVRAERRTLLSWIAAPIGAEVGFSSAGAGALTGLTLLHCTNLEPACVVGTDLAFGLSIALIGGGMHLLGGTVDRALLGMMLAGGVPGAVLGAWTAGRIPARAVRAVLATVMVFLGQQLLTKGLAGFAR
jgi:hypothetical protein